MGKKIEIHSEQNIHSEKLFEDGQYVNGPTDDIDLITKECPFRFTLTSDDDSNIRICIGAKCMCWDAVYRRCGMNNSAPLLNMQLISAHIHNQHKHNRHHPANIKGLNCGGHHECGSVPKMHNAIMELTSKQDIDMDGQIYGVDFIIDPADPEKPDTLIGVEANTVGINPNAQKILYADYLRGIF